MILKEEDGIIEYRISKEQEPKNRQLALRNNANVQEETQLSLYERVLQLDEYKRGEPKEIILDEDDYLCHLEEIIKRDYFPKLYELEQKVKLIS